MRIPQFSNPDPSIQNSLTKNDSKSVQKYVSDFFYTPQRCQRSLKVKISGKYFTINKQNRKKVRKHNLSVFLGEVFETCFSINVHISITAKCLKPVKNHRKNGSLSCANLSPQSRSFLGPNGVIFFY